MALQTVTAPGSWRMTIEAEFAEELVVERASDIQITVSGAGEFDVGILSGWGDRDTGEEAIFEVPEAVSGSKPGTFWRPGGCERSPKPVRIRGRSETATVLYIDAS